MPNETKLKQLEELFALNYPDPESSADFDLNLACRLMNDYAKLLFTLGKL